MFNTGFNGFTPTDLIRHLRSTAMADAKVVVVAGYGVGISAAVAKRFGAEGYSLALLARTQSRLDDAAEELAKAGITAKAYATDLTDAAAVKATVAAVHADLGPISVLFWNPYGDVAGFLTATPEQLLSSFNAAVTGLLTAVQAAHSDLKATQGSVLVTGSGFALEVDAMVQLAVDMEAASLAFAKAAQRKLVHILSKGLAGDGVYVAEVTVLGAVAGTSSDPEGKVGIAPEAIAAEFWQLQQKRDPAVWFVKKQ